MATVTLLRNPAKNPKSNPHRRHRRNPAFAKALTQDMPDWMQIVSGVAGAGVAMQVPNMLPFSRKGGWVNVALSAVLTGVGAYAVHKITKKRDTATAFATGGMIITGLKALYVLTKGSFGGVAPEMNFAKSLPMLPAAAPTPATAAATGRIGGLTSTPNALPMGDPRSVGGFRESKYSGQEFSDEPLLV